MPELSVFVYSVAISVFLGLLTFVVSTALYTRLSWWVYGKIKHLKDHIVIPVMVLVAILAIIATISFGNWLIIAGVKYLYR